MTAKVTHTPTPWDANGTLEIVAGKWGEDVPTVATCCCDLPRGLDGYANAAHIVRCVNRHDALVTALRDLLFSVRTPDALNEASALQAENLLAAIDADKPDHA